MRETKVWCSFVGIHLRALTFKHVCHLAYMMFSTGPFLYAMGDEFLKQCLLVLWSPLFALTICAKPYGHGLFSGHMMARGLDSWSRCKALLGMCAYESIIDYSFSFFCVLCLVACLCMNKPGWVQYSIASNRGLWSLQLSLRMLLCILLLLWISFQDTKWIQLLNSYLEKKFSSLSCVCASGAFTVTVVVILLKPVSSSDIYEQWLTAAGCVWVVWQRLILCKPSWVWRAGTSLCVFLSVLCLLWVTFLQKSCVHFIAAGFPNSQLSWSGEPVVLKTFKSQQNCLTRLFYLSPCFPWNPLFLYLPLPLIVKSLSFQHIRVHKKRQPHVLLTRFAMLVL